MNGLSADLRKTISIASIIIAVIMCVICLIFVNSWQTMVLGILYGTLIAIINFTIMAKAGEKAIEMTPEKAKTKMTLNYVLRYGIYIVTLIIAVKVSFLSPIGTVLGFFTSILALYLTQVLDTPGNRDKLKKLLRRAK
ncbi:MAG: ATP synthase subunit I [Firmicutes bacterium]|nr:ATP synthase subunit I [Bacillota bacterium]